MQKEQSFRCLYIFSLVTDRSQQQLGNVSHCRCSLDLQGIGVLVASYHLSRFAMASIEDVVGSGALCFLTLTIAHEVNKLADSFRAVLLS